MLLSILCLLFIIKMGSYDEHPAALADQCSECQRLGLTASTANTLNSSTFTFSSFQSGSTLSTFQSSIPFGRKQPRSSPMSRPIRKRKHNHHDKSSGFSESSSSSQPKSPKVRCPKTASLTSETDGDSSSTLLVVHYH